MTRALDALRRYPLVVTAVATGVVIIVIASFALSETALMWVGGIVGIAIGGTIVLAERRSRGTDANR